MKRMMRRIRGPTRGRVPLANIPDPADRREVVLERRDRGSLFRVFSGGVAPILGCGGKTLVVAGSVW